MLKVSSEKLYDLAHWVGLSPADAGEGVIEYVTKFIEKHAVQENLKGIGSKKRK